MRRDEQYLRPGDVLLAVVALLCAAWWSYMAGTSDPTPAEQPRPLQPSVTAPEGTLSPMTAPGSEPVEVSLP